MSTLILISLMIVSGVLITSILLQHMGTGFGSSLGGMGIAYQTRRGLEKVLFSVSIVCACMMTVLSVMYIMI